MIYLDNAATTRQKPQPVIDAVVSAMTTLGNSARGTHEGSLSASRMIYGTREKLATFFNCPRPDHVVFTANSTEALNMAICGLLSGIAQGRVAAASVNIVAKNPNDWSKGMVLCITVEFYAILSLLASMLMIINISG